MLAGHKSGGECLPGMDKLARDSGSFLAALASGAGVPGGQRPPEVAGPRRDTKISGAARSSVPFLPT